MTRLWQGRVQVRLACSLPLQPGLVKVRKIGGHGMGDYTTAIWVTIGLTVALTVPVVWQFLQPNDDDFGDLTRRK